MNNYQVRYEYRFHAVGQGLFSSGRLALGPADASAPSRGHVFRWIFDCGEHSRWQTNVTREVDHYQALERFSLSHDPKVHLVCISHYDQDHISGLKLLLRSVRIGILVLPYYTQLERLILVSQQKQATADELRYAIAPVRALLADAGDNVPERIVFVRSAPPREKPSEIPEGSPPSGDGFFLELPASDLNDNEWSELGITAEEAKSAGTQVQALDDDQPLKAGGCWEFMFFHERFPDIPEATITALRTTVDALLGTGMPLGRAADWIKLIDELQAAFDSALGNTGPKRNRISLWMYAGPLGAAQGYFTCAETDLKGAMMGVHGSIMPPHAVDVCPLDDDAFTRFSIMYTGDGSVKKPDQLNAAKAHFMEHRFWRTAVLQVPHHGSDKNWHAGATLAWPPIHGVFSSRKKSKKHPGNIVKADLAGADCTLRTHEGQRVMAGGVLYWN